MASVLDAIMKSLKMPPPASIKSSEDKIEDLGEVAATSASPSFVEAGPSGTKPMEQAKEDLTKKMTLPVPKAPSQDDL
jgi:hypothetical protein